MLVVKSAKIYRENRLYEVRPTKKSLVSRKVYKPARHGAIKHAKAYIPCSDVSTDNFIERMVVTDKDAFTELDSANLYKMKGQSISIPAGRDAR